MSRKYTIIVEVEIDESAWSAEYGTPGAESEVEDYVLNLLQTNPAVDAGALTIAGFAVRS